MSERSDAEPLPSGLSAGVPVYPRKSERTATRVIAGEALVVVIDRNELHRLNDVGTRVLELCDGTRSLDAIAETIVDEFEVDAATARRDVESFVTELTATGVITLGEHS